MIVQQVTGDPDVCSRVSRIMDATFAERLVVLWNILRDRDPDPNLDALVRVTRGGGVMRVHVDYRKNFPDAPATSAWEHYQKLGEADRKSMGLVEARLQPKVTARDLVWVHIPQECALACTLWQSIMFSKGGVA